MSISVCHLISSFRLPDGPSAGILAQIEHGDQTRFRSAVWSMYDPPPDRDASAILRERSIDYDSLATGRSFLDLRALPRLVRKLRILRPDVLHCHLVRANLYGSVAARLAGVPVVVRTVRNIEDYMLSRRPAYAAARIAERWTSRWVDVYVAVSEDLRWATIDRIGIPSSKIVTILNAVDLGHGDDHSPRPDSGPVTIGTVGWLEPRKNHAMLIRIADALRRTHADFRVVIAGEGPERARLEASIRDLGLEAIVTMAGLMRDVPRLLESLDIFVMTSITEGLPRALMEAMAAGLPVVATDAGGTREGVDSGVSGFVLPVGDESGLASALKRLIEDRSLRIAMGKAGRERARRLFDPRRMAARYEELYERLLC